MANSWFRLYAEFAHDAKVQMMSECDQRRLVMLFCIRCNGDVTLQDEEVAFQLRISNEEWQVTKASFVSRGFINSDNEVLNWDKRQFLSDSSAERVARHRANKKQERNVTVTPSDTEQIQNRTDTEQKKKKPTQLSLLTSRGIPHDLASDWIQIRNKKRQPLTETALNATIREAKEAGLTLEQAITIACENTWAGFKAEYLKGKPSARGNKQEGLEQSNRTATSGWMPPEMREVEA
jgi:hypothetical protein